jgi:MFS family permease
LGPNLTGLGGWVGRNVGVPELAGPFVISIAAFCLAALSVGVRLRPDPLVLAREAAATDRRGVGSSDGAPRPGLGEITRALRGRPVVLSALLSLWVSQAVMVALMSMTPIEMTQDGEGLSVIGLVISVHIAGMYAFSPVVGWFSQRVGQGIGLVVGHLLLLGAALVTGIANGMGHTSMLVGLFMLGLGWSCCLIVSSTLLTEGVPERLRPTTQGFADVALGLSGAAGGAIAGVVIDVAGFRALASCVAVLVLVSLLFASLAQGAQRIRATSAALSSESQGELA